MITKTLDEIFDKIAQAMRNSIDLNAYEEDTEFSFCYDEHGYFIEGFGRVGGTWNEYGDGYWSPSEYEFKDGWGTLENLTITHHDEETDEETEFAKDVVNGIFDRLDRELSNYMSNY